MKNKRRFLIVLTVRLEDIGDESGTAGKINLDFAALGRRNAWNVEMLSKIKKLSIELQSKSCWKLKRS